MKLLILDWGSYTQRDITEALQRRHVKCRVVNYYFGDKNTDEFFLRHFLRYMEEDKYDAVFSVNYFPLLAVACREKAVPYLSWSYDNPLNVPEIEKTLGFPTNFVFLFDRAQTSKYHRMGFDSVRHLPLGINVQRLKGIRLSKEEAERYASDVAFVGKLYQSEYEELLAPLSDYTRGYLNAVSNAQFLVYGRYFAEELLTDDFLREVNRQYASRFQGFSLSRDQLSYVLAAHITRRERMALLSLLSRRHGCKLYTREKPELLDKVIFMGTTDYYAEMPKIFKAGKINLNITLKILETGIPLRALDILGAGGLLFSNYQEELAEHFMPGVDFVQYDDIGDAVEKAEYYLKNDGLRGKIAQNGQIKAFEEFSYEKKLEELLCAAGLSN